MNRSLIVSFLTLLLTVVTSACQAFTTVYNVPPNTLPSLIGSNTQVNVYPGGVLNDINFNASPSQRSELNVYGGSVLGSYGGSVPVSIFSGSSLNHTTANIYNGEVPEGFEVQSSSILNLNGGTLGRTSISGGSIVNLHGGHLTGRRFLINSGGGTINVYGGETQIFSGNITNARTGVLEDGSVYIYEASGSYSFTQNFIASPIPAVSSLIINAPTDTIPKGLRIGQTLNLSSGGVVGNYFNSVNATVNVNGGSVGTDFGTAGTTVTLNSGTIGDRFTTYSGTTVNMNGGHIGSSFAANRGTINIHGGTVGSTMAVRNSTVVNIDGGSFGDAFTSEDSSKINMMGGEFILDGAPASGSSYLPLPTSILSGTLADGSVFIFSSADGDNFERSGATRSLNLVSAAVPPIGPAVINAPVDPVPKGLRAGQTLNLGAGASIPNLFAGVNATLNVNGGTVGNDVEVLGTPVTINSGNVGDGFEAFSGSPIVMNGGTMGNNSGTFANSPLTLHGGTIGDDFRARSNVTVNGGEIGDDFGNIAGTTVTINGGRIGDSFDAYGIVNMTGGTIGDQLANRATINMSGGSIGDQFVNSINGVLTMNGGSFGQEYWGTSSSTNSRLILRGGEYQKDGVNITTSSVNLNDFGVFSGVLADGTVFILASAVGDRFDGTARPTLNYVSLPPVGPALINAPTDAMPKGLRSGQTLNLGTGSETPTNFAAIDATINVNGGTVTKGLEILRSTLTLNSGMIGDRFAAHAGSTVNILNGAVGNKLVAGPGSVVSIQGGTIGNNATAKQGSHVIIEDGTIGDNFLADQQSRVAISGGSIGANFSAELASAVTISGGSIGPGFSALRKSIVHIGGGTIGADFNAVDGADVRLFGSQFEIRDLITGALIEDLDAGMSLGDTLDINLRDVTLSGILADNTPFSFDLNSVDGLGDYFHAGANLSITLSELVLPPDVPEPSSLTILLAGLIVGGTIRQRIG